MKAAKHRVSLRQRRPVSSSAGELFTGQQNAEFSADRWSEAAVPYERSLGKKMEAYTAASLHLMREAFDITHFGDLLDVGCGSGAVTDAVVAARYPLDTFTGTMFCFSCKNVHTARHRPFVLVPYRTTR
ncbi:hypothetical protein DIPPA_22008 [Diplonema papillatum]|nr:hypothetical protein DIPPA_22008 [Diplonema papillatum]